MTMYIEAVAHRFGDAVPSMHLLARGQAVVHAFAQLFLARRAEPLATEASNHMLRDLGVARADVSGGSPCAAWPLALGAL